MTIKPMDKMGSLNNAWGVCGFTSTFYAMFAQNKGKRPELANARHHEHTFCIVLIRAGAGGEDGGL